MNHPLQAIRRTVEQPIEDALLALDPSIPSFTSNEFYDEDDALSEFALLRLSFGLMNLLDIGCQTEFIRGSMVVEVYTPKGEGPGRGQDAAVAVLRAIAPMRGLRPAERQAEVVTRVGVVQGPTFTPLSKRPHLATVLTFPITARVRGVVTPDPPHGQHIITTDRDHLVARVNGQLMRVGYR